MDTMQVLVINVTVRRHATLQIQSATLLVSVSLAQAPTCQPNKTKLNLSWGQGYYCIWFCLSACLHVCLSVCRTRIAYLTVYTNLEPPNQNKSLTKCFPIGLGSLEPVLGLNPISHGGGDFTPTQFYTT